MGIVGSPRTLGRWCDCWPLTMAESTCTSCWRLGWCDPTLQKMGNMWARGPWRNQHFQQQRAMIFFNLRSVSWTSIVGKLPRNAMRTWSTTHFQYLSMVFAGDCSPHHLHFFWKQFPSSSIFQFHGQQLEQVLVHIVLLPYIFICLAEQLRVGQAIDTCLYRVTYEAFAPCSQLIDLLRSSNSTLSRTHVPRRAHSVSTRISFNSWKMNHQERTIKNVIAAPPPTPQNPHKQSQATSSVATCMQVHQRWIIKSVLSRTLSPPATPPPKTPQATSSVATCMSILSVRWTMFETPQRSWSDNVRHLYVTSTTLNASSSYTTSM